MRALQCVWVPRKQHTKKIILISITHTNCQPAPIGALGRPVRSVGGVNPANKNTLTLPARARLPPTLYSAVFGCLIIKYIFFRARLALPRLLRLMARCQKTRDPLGLACECVCVCVGWSNNRPLLPAKVVRQELAKQTKKRSMFLRFRSLLRNSLETHSHTPLPRVPALTCSPLRVPPPHTIPSFSSASSTNTQRRWLSGRTRARSFLQEYLIQVSIVASFSYWLGSVLTTCVYS